MESQAQVGDSNALAQPGEPIFVCPACRGQVDREAAAYACSGCRRRFPIIEGIADFRLRPDRFLGIEDDRRKGLRVLERCGGDSFEAALDAYYSLTPKLPDKLAARYKRHQLAGEKIGELTLNELGRNSNLAPESAFLDLGCGSGGLLAAASRRFALVTGVDAAFRWLVMARLRLREAGADALLVCANAEYLPFPAGAFQVLVSTDLVEHVADPAAVFRECRRVAACGVCYFTANNRYSLLGEPHVGIWGVGYLPRGLQRKYVRLIRGYPYDKVRLLSARELRSLARRVGIRGKLSPARLYAEHLGGAANRLAGIYNRLSRVPLFSRLLTWLGPRLQMVGRIERVPPDGS